MYWVLQDLIFLREAGVSVDPDLFRFRFGIRESQLEYGRLSRLSNTADWPARLQLPSRINFMGLA
jgi:hypothetical protein